MATEVILPKMGLTMEEGTIISWLKHEGDPVESGETILQIETDKVTVDVEAQAGGVLGPLLSREGDLVPVGQVIAHILEPGESPPAQQSSPEQPKTKEGSRATPAVTGERRRFTASPVARRVASELGVDITVLAGSGPGGRIMEQDVRRAAQTPPSPPVVAAAEPATGEFEPLAGIRKVAAERLTHSFTTTPHFYLSVEVDAGSLLEARQRLLEPVQNKSGLRLTLSDLFIKITAQALQDNPEVNTIWGEGGVCRLASVDIGLAVATDRGLLVPVLRAAEAKNLSTIAAERQDLVARARSGGLTWQELEGGAITISNLGTYAVDQFHAIINPPQAAILAVGQIKERPFVVDGQLAVRPTVFLTLSIDHRILDGAQAATFLNRIVELVEEPFMLIPV